MKKRAVPFIVALVTLTAGCEERDRDVRPAEACISCHENDRERAAIPPHTATGFPTACEQCHTQVEWSPASFDHRSFPLTGAHSWVSCASCHDQEPVPRRCVGCHAEDRDRAENPDHTATSFPDTCESCHNNVSWKPAAFDHSALPFVGGHADVACAACHADASAPARERGKTCVDCHDADRARAKSPNHLVVGFSADCAQCHTVTSWDSANFAHDKFRLTGVHATTPCADCHDVEPVPNTCIGCHDEERTTPTNPDHLAPTFSTRCDDCHSTAGWKPVALDHNKFPLTGGHSAVGCESCHTDPNDPTKPIGTTCAACHITDAGTSTALDHTLAGFPADCAECHSVVRWKPATFEHSAFPLAGGHQGVACATCHDPEPVPNTCVGCHDDDRQKPTNPDHLASGFSTRCDDCHSIDAWKPAAFDHSKFPLTGGHSTVACTRCHTDPANPEVPKGRTCVECHDADRDKPLPPAPDHRQAGFPTDCASCHTVDSFKGAVLDHSAFPLTGKHATVPCGSCHGQVPLPATCVGCHDEDRKIPTAPDHLAPTFSTRCDDCHTTSGWKPASFDHSKFPLTGAHSNVACTTCHTDSQNPSVPIGTLCVDCHETPVGAFPDHGATGFPTNCASCHTTVAWTPASFDHDRYFVLSSGPHSRYSACATCHTNPQDATAFSCFIGCHEHNQADMDAKHREEGEYRYDSAACLRCHPRGQRSD